MDTAAEQSDRLRLGALGAALEREHREIDAGIDSFRAAVAATEGGAAGDAPAASLRRAIDALRRQRHNAK